MEMQKRRLGKTQQKILLLLMTGLALGLTHSAKTHIRLITNLPREWREIDRRALGRSVGKLYQSKLVKQKHNKDGTWTLVLADQGKKLALRYNLATLKILKPTQWDGKWRVVTYDIPEKLRNLRIDVLRTIQSLGFVELQHSVFVHPFECRNEIDFSIEACDARPYIRYMLVDEFDISEPLLKHFKLKKA